MFRGKLGALGGGDDDVGKATENTKVREIRVMSNKGGVREFRSSLGTRSIAEVDHCEKRVTVKAIGKAGGKDKSIDPIRECTT